VSRRISVSIGFWLLTGAGLTAPEAVEVLNDTIERGGLRLWRDSIVVSPSHFRRRMSIGRYPHLPYGAAMVVPKEAWQTYPVFELNEDQIRRIIAKLAKPLRQPKPSGRHRHPMRQDILDEYDRRCREGEPHENTDLARWAATVLEKLKKYDKVPAPHRDTIGRWLLKGDQPPT
jgi:hypothetical protein